MTIARTGVGVSRAARLSAARLSTALLSTALLVCGLAAACAHESADGGGSARAASAAKAPDTIFVNGAIYTVDAKSSWAEALAVADGRITAVGSSAQVKALAGSGTRIVDLGGRMVMPGIQDLHGHPMQAGEAHFYECSFPFTFTLPQIVAQVKACAARTPKGQWIRGGQWAQGLLTARPAAHRRILDAITIDHPVFLGDETVHDAWLNSRALEALGIGKDTPDPAGGLIDRDADGAPNGILHDNATFQAKQKLPPRTAAEYAAAIAWAMGQMNAVGVTTLKDALADRYAMQAYRDLDAEGRLTMTVATSLAWKGSWTESRAAELENIANRVRYRGPHVLNDFIKIFLDGIPPTKTAAMLDPYLPDTKHGRDFSGVLMFPPEVLREDLIALDRQGLSVKIHATGDRAVRVALDAIEAARRANGPSARIHEIAHAELVHAADLPRFKALNVAAEMCPILWYRSPLVDVMAAAVGEEKANHFWPTRSLLDAGALVTYGSDWPSVVPDPSPWRGIESLVTRRNPDTNAGDPLWPEQAIDLSAAIRIFTRNGAIATGRGDRSGSLEVGKAADLIVLDRHLFEIPVGQISETKVLSTVIGGKEIYRRP